MLISLYDNLTPKQADTYGLVLSSAGIFYQTKKKKSGWQLWVHQKDENEALFHIRKYGEENPLFQKPHPPSIAPKIQFFNGIWVAVLIMVVYIAVGDSREVFTNLYGASASKIMSGEIYRGVSALLLHANAVHLIGNMAGIAFFGAVVCAINGTGVGWLMILLSGWLGNYINAWLYQSQHMAVGASTAIFGAVGMMAAYQFWQKIKQPEERVKAWLPVAGGMALLGILGSGEGRVDIMAHLFGFGSGIALQTIYQGLVLVWHRQVLPIKYQAVCTVIVFTILGLSCLRLVWFHHG